MGYNEQLSGLLYSTNKISSHFLICTLLKGEFRKKSTVNKSGAGMKYKEEMRMLPVATAWISMSFSRQEDQLREGIFFSHPLLSFLLFHSPLLSCSIRSTGFRSISEMPVSTLTLVSHLVIDRALAPRDRPLRVTKSQALKQMHRKLLSLFPKTTREENEQVSVTFIHPAEIAQSPGLATEYQEQSCT